MLDYALNGNATQLKHGQDLRPYSRSDANCATILVSIAEWYGDDRPRPAVLQKVLDAVKAGPDKLPSHDVWLKRTVGMADYSKS